MSGAWDCYAVGLATGMAVAGLGWWAHAQALRRRMASMRRWDAFWRRMELARKGGAA